MNVRIDLVSSYSQAVSAISTYLKNTSNKRGLVCTTNPEFVLLAQKDKSFLELINSSVLSVPDGYGVLVGLEYLSYIQNLPEQPFLLKSFTQIYYLGVALFKGIRNKLKYNQTITGVDLVRLICQLCAKEGYSVGFVGGWPKDSFGNDLQGTYNLANEAADILKKEFPSLKVAFAFSDVRSSSSDDEVCVRRIQHAMEVNELSLVDVVFVAYAFGAQESWYDRLSKVLPLRLGVGVGGSFDYISDRVIRAPAIIRRCHMEWIFRMFIQPFRAPRTFNAFIMYLYKLYVFYST